MNFAVGTSCLDDGIEYGLCSSAGKHITQLLKMSQQTLLDHAVKGVSMSMSDFDVQNDDTQNNYLDVTNALQKFYLDSYVAFSSTDVMHDSGNLVKGNSVKSSIPDVANMSINTFSLSVVDGLYLCRKWAMVKLVIFSKIYIS